MTDDGRTLPDPISDDDLGPEPDWLSGALNEEPAPTQDSVQPAATETAKPPVQESVVSEPTTNVSPPPESKSGGRTTERPAETRKASQFVKPAKPVDDPIETTAIAISSEPVAPTQARSTHPLLFSAIPAILLVILSVLAWIATNQSLNDITTWSALKNQGALLLPARWSLFMWWVAAPLLGVFLVYSMLPGGREITRIRLTGPLLAIALIGTGVWMVAQHWRWEPAGVISAIIASSAMLIAFLLVALSRSITHFWQRLLAVLPLSVGLAYGAMLLTLAWQHFSDQPFGQRGTTILIMFAAVLVAAIISFFLHDGAFSMVLTIWFLGVAQQQWGEDALVSLSSILVVIITATLATMGVILSIDSHKPAFTTEMPPKRGRISFRKRKPELTENSLPE